MRKIENEVIEKCQRLAKWLLWSVFKRILMLLWGDRIIVRSGGVNFIACGKNQWHFCVHRKVYGKENLIKIINCRRFYSADWQSILYTKKSKHKRECDIKFESVLFRWWWRCTFKNVFVNLCHHVGGLQFLHWYAWELELECRVNCNGQKFVHIMRLRDERLRMVNWTWNFKIILFFRKIVCNTKNIYVLIMVLILKENPKKRERKWKKVITTNNKVNELWSFVVIAIYY